ncbi:MauE/DoxX family redox-associated membrane protein [Planobispora rosea]|uniref:MauE/DoxX family redox-associated membrane protein n=1 Tax=Planobispora rosea TaxID=35762 RepID=UPI000839FFF9|nr:MauE/DoxX family redox-associated membrane protein [Planobispora rosea]
MIHLALACRVLLAAVLLIAVGSKLSRTAFGEFVSSTGRLLPPRLTGRQRSAAVLVLAVEAATVPALLVPATAALGLVAAVGLLTAFTIGIGGALHRGERAPCRCFGASRTRLGPLHLARNLTLIAVGVTGLAASASAGTAHPGGAVLAVFAGIVLAALMVRLDDLAALFAPTHPRS